MRHKFDAWRTYLQSGQQCDGIIFPNAFMYGKCVRPLSSEYPDDTIGWQAR